MHTGDPLGRLERALIGRPTSGLDAVARPGMTT